MTPPKSPSPEVRSNRNLWSVTLTSFFTDVSSEMLFNLLPLFLANVLGAKPAVIGLIEGVAETTASLVKGFSGWLSDRLGRRKWLAVFGYGLSAISKPFLYFATVWEGVLAVRFADRIGKGVRNPPRDALIADSVSARQRGLAFGLHRAGDTAGALVGLIIALLVVLALQADTVTLNRETFQTLVLISVVPAILGVLALALGAREAPRAADKGERGAARARLTALGPRYGWFLVIVLVFTLGNSADAFLILRAQERGLSVPGVLAMLITFTAVYALFSTPAGALSDRLGRRRLIVFGWAVYAVLYLGFAVAWTGVQIWLLYGFYGLYYAAVEGVAKALVADIVTPAQRGTAYGFYNATVGLAALPASLLAGVLWENFGAPAPFIVGAILALIAVIMLIGWDRRYGMQGASRHTEAEG